MTLSVPAMPAYYFSLLTRQLALGEEAFLRRYPNHWLVWEAGGTPGYLSDVTLSVVDTRLAETGKAALRPGHGDALCLVLKSPDREPLRVGRAVDNEIVIAEPTVSRLHARLEPIGDAWHLVALSEQRQTLVGGKLADPGQSVQLSSGQAIELGGVRLAFYDSKAFKNLVSAVPLRSVR